MRKMLNTRVFTVGLMIVIAAIFRLMPHIPNVTPIAAMALFGGVYFTDKKLAILFPLAALAISDLIIGLHFTMFAVYFSFVITSLIGIWASKRKSARVILGSVIVSSVVFFVITNLAMWAFGTIYPKNAAGLAECYTMAIPFFRNSLVGDLVYSGLMFGIFELAVKAFPKLSAVKVQN